MEKEKVMHVLSVLLDELAKSIWKGAIGCWTLSGDDSESLMVKLEAYEGYTISLSRLEEMIMKFDMPSCEVSFRNNEGILEILITLEKINASE